MKKINLGIMKIIFILCFNIILYQNVFSQPWLKLANFPHDKLYKAVAFSINGFGYAGLGSSSGKLERDFWRYNPIENKWSQIDSLPAPGRAGSFSFVINGRAYVGGGETFEGNTRIMELGFTQILQKMNSLLSILIIPKLQRLMLSIFQVVLFINTLELNVQKKLFILDPFCLEHTY